jgi:hypothetical protein
MKRLSRVVLAFVLLSIPARAPKAALLAATFNPPASSGSLVFTELRNSTNFTTRS